MEHRLASDLVSENGVVFSSGKSITFGCTYDLSDQTLESNTYTVKTDDMDFDRLDGKYVSKF